MRQFLLITAAAVAFSATASAEEMKYRDVLHLTDVKSLEIPNTDGHRLILGHYDGLSSFPDGSVATTSINFASDYTNGSGEVLDAYETLTFEDGSVLYMRGHGATKVVGGKSEIKATSEIIGGKGRFAGAKGEMASFGIRPAQLAGGIEYYQRMHTAVAEGHDFPLICQTTTRPSYSSKLGTTDPLGAVIVPVRS
jgi:hypothetical protein